MFGGLVGLVVYLWVALGTHSPKAAAVGLLSLATILAGVLVFALSHSSTPGAPQALSSKWFRGSTWTGAGAGLLAIDVLLAALTQTDPYVLPLIAFFWGVPAYGVALVCTLIGHYRGVRQKEPLAIRRAGYAYVLAGGLILAIFATWPEKTFLEASGLVAMFVVCVGIVCFVWSIRMEQGRTDQIRPLP
jgi:hypothetical protein